MIRDKIKDNIDRIFDMMHRIILGGSAGARTKTFMKNLSVSLIGGMSAFVLLFIANIIAARVLGVYEYGMYSVIFSFAQIVALLYVMELDVSALYFFAGGRRDRQTIASLWMMFVINVIIFTFLAWSIYIFFDSGIDSATAFFGVIALAMIIGSKRMVDAFLRIADLFAPQAILRFAEGSIIVGTVIIGAMVIDQWDATYYIGALIGGGCVFVGVGGYMIRRHITVMGWHGTQMNEIFRHNVNGLINPVINGVVKNVDTLIIAVVLGVASAGVYAIYFTASVVVGARITQLFINVLFPSARVHYDRIVSMVTKIDRLAVRTSVPFFIISVCGVAVIITLYGAAYPFVWMWVILGALYIVVHFFASIYGWLLSSVSTRGYRSFNMSYVIGFMVYCAILAMAYVGDAFSITAVLSAAVVYRFVAGVYVRWRLYVLHCG